MRIGIIGCGIVGEATARVLEDNGYPVERHDPPKGLYAEGPFDVAFICVPTPLGEGNVLSQGWTDEAVLQLAAEVVVFRSTLRIGYFVDRAVYMPCFAREDYAYEDETNARMRVYGGEFEDCLKVAELFGHVQHAFFTDFRTAEFIKLALNAKLATDISFATELSQAAEKLGVEWNDVAYVLKTDKRIGPDAYLRPGPFGGKCLPKDTRNLQTQTGSKILDAVLEVNERVPVAAL